MRKTHWLFISLIVLLQTVLTPEAATRALNLAPTPFPTPVGDPTFAGNFHLVKAADGLPSGKIHDIWITPQGRLWVALDVGTFVHDNGTWVQLYEGVIETLLGADKDGRVWAILEGGTAIAAYEPTGAWTVYGPAEGWLALPMSEYLSPGYGDGFVTDQYGYRWLATGLNDIRRFDPVSQTWEVLRAEDIGFAPPEETGYQGHFLTDVAFTLDQKVWVSDCIGLGESLSGQGIRAFDGKRWTAFPYTAGQCVFDIEVDTRGRVWAGAFDALMTYDPGSGNWSKIPLPHWERKQLVSQIDVDTAGNPWVEILRYGGASAFGQIARYHLQDGAWIEDFTGWFSSLALGANGSAWLCSQGNVLRLENNQQLALGSIPSDGCVIDVDGTGRVWVSDSENLWWFE